MFVMFGDTTLADSAKSRMCAIWRDRIAALTPEIAKPARAVVEREGVLDELKQTTVPILALIGEEDHAYSVEQSRRIATVAPMGRCAVLSRAGHSLALEQPDAVNDHLARHFASVDVGDAAPALFGEGT